MKKYCYHYVGLLGTRHPAPVEANFFATKQPASFNFPLNYFSAVLEEHRLQRVARKPLNHRALAVESVFFEERSSRCAFFFFFFFGENNGGVTFEQVRFCCCSQSFTVFIHGHDHSKVHHLQVKYIYNE